MDLDLTIRISAFLGLLAIMAVWERLASRRAWSASLPFTGNTGQYPTWQADETEITHHHK